MIYTSFLIKMFELIKSHSCYSALLELTYTECQNLVQSLHMHDLFAFEKLLTKWIICLNSHYYHYSSADLNETLRVLLALKYQSCHDYHLHSFSFIMSLTIFYFNQIFIISSSQFWIFKAELEHFAELKLVYPFK